MTFQLAAFSDSIARLIGQGAPLLTAIRVGPNRHTTGLLCPGGAIVTTDQALPASDAYTVVLPNRSLAAAQPGFRDPSSNLATLRLDGAVPVSVPEAGVAALGGIVVVLGTDSDASPTVRLSLVHRFLRTADGPTPVLDLPAGLADPGSVVLDANGRLIGLAAPGTNGEVIVIPAASIGWVLHPGQAVAAPRGQPAAVYKQPVTSGRSYGRRGWLGVALQPITVPDQLIARAGQASARMVVNITTNGPADRAAMRVGDVILSLNGTSLIGQHVLRTFLEEERIGSTVEVRLLRDGNIVTTHLVIAEQP